MLVLSAHAQQFRPGDVIEYKAHGTYPPKWERGVFVSELPGGKQYVIREKPTEFSPQGSQIAYSVDEVRRPGSAPAPTPATAAPAPAPNREAAPASPPPPNLPGGGLLTKGEVIAYARQVMGPNPWNNPRRDSALAQIRDLITRRGVGFVKDDDFRSRMDAQGTNSSHITFAVDSNYGPAPQLNSYLGTWLLRAANRGSRSLSADGRWVTTTDSQAESGRITIEPAGTYVWEVLRGDPASKWLRGKWRAVAQGEANPWEGGPALWLEKAKQGYDCMMRMDRTPGWTDWINVGMGAARTPVEFGRRK